MDIVNNDGELPIDIADTDEMENLLQTEIYKQGELGLLLLVDQISRYVCSRY